MEQHNDKEAGKRALEQEGSGVVARIPNDAAPDPQDAPAAVETREGAPVWLVTGSSRGFGAAFVKTALAHGCRVAATARNVDAVYDAFGERDDLLAVQLDVTDPASIKRAVHEVVDAWGRVDVLVNNAGYGIFGAFEETSDEETRAIFDTNVFGTMNVIRAVLPVMRDQGKGRVVNMGSMGSFACDPGGALYDTTKFAVAALSEVLSLEMAPFGIESMVVEPGMFRTDFFDGSSIKMTARTIEAYDGTPARGAVEFCLGNNHQQQGDPMKAAEFVYSVVSDPQPMPWWLPVGPESFRKFEKKLTRMIEAVKPYEEAGSQTSLDA